ncbi:hypothetical protein TKK_0001788 [Trichogramma kaykai]|uniref:DNA 5'-3' helicase n=1 Tax=Trichogramma kaykai TaxID=54128 RepID=A0ABD2XGE6_9HYME
MGGVEEFPFPFEPYPIQSDFMRNLYACLEQGNLGIFESPTGTGKTLSIICGALKWLLDNKKKQKNELLKSKADLELQIKEIKKKHEGDWFSAQTEQMTLNMEIVSLQQKFDALLKREEKIKNYKQKVKQYNEGKIENKKRDVNKWKTKRENETENSRLDEKVENIDDFMDTDLILQELDKHSNDSEDDDDNESNEQECKIYFCSRTHSQLSQFIGELKKSPYNDKVSLVPIASRNNYCINSKVKALKNMNLINDLCQQLQRKSKTTSKDEKTIKKSKTKTTSCPYMPGNQEILIAEILTEIKDIEDIVKTSEELKTCPYYSTRKSIEDGQVILVPYNSILHKNTRESLGIDIKNNVLIIDEAHNLLEAIERMHSVSITGKHILQSLNQLTQYQEKFKSVLTAKNVLHLSQLSFCLKKLIKLLGGTSKSLPNDKPKNADNKLFGLDEFEISAEIDTINIFDLIEFITKSKLAHKLRGYAEKYGNENIVAEPCKEKKGVSEFLKSLQKKDSPEIKENTKQHEDEIDKDQIASPLFVITSFLETLKTKCSDGRIFVVPGTVIGDGYLRFLLLNPASHFSDIVKEARAIVLAGGTMEPMSEFKDQLFLNAGAKPERIMTFSCDHIVPKENILTCILQSGPTGVEFEFNYQNRQNTKLLDELGRTLVNLCNIIPAGIVVFLPSYSYEELLIRHLETNGILAKIGLKKAIFREPKSSTLVNLVLENFSDSIKKAVKPKTGAILFSVVGGKLSEGLNFSDDLGRCVIVVGMPYPNIKSLELQEKIKYLKENVNSNAGSIFYENSCMKAVNQCIGRAVRHINDYSTVVLLDRRYANKQKALPGWIRRTCSVQPKFSGAVQALARFFAAKKKQTSNQ